MYNDPELNALPSPAQRRKARNMADPFLAKLAERMAALELEQSRAIKGQQLIINALIVLLQAIEYDYLTTKTDTKRIEQRVARFANNAKSELVIKQGEDEASERILEFKIEAGATTCASEPGKFCRFVGTRKMATQYVCRLFPTADDSYSPLKDRNGWLQRLPECLAVELRGAKLTGLLGKEEINVWEFPEKPVLSQ